MLVLRGDIHSGHLIRITLARPMEPKKCGDPEIGWLLNVNIWIFRGEVLVSGTGIFFSDRVLFFLSMMGWYKFFSGMFVLDCCLLFFGDAYWFVNSMIRFIIPSISWEIGSTNFFSPKKNLLALANLTLLLVCVLFSNRGDRSGPSSLSLRGR